MQMATGILLNHLDIAAVNASKIQPGMPENLVCFCENWVCVNPTTYGTSSNATGNVFRGKLSGEGICSGKCPRVMYGELFGLGNTPG